MLKTTHGQQQDSIPNPAQKGKFPGRLVAFVVNGLIILLPALINRAIRKIAEKLLCLLFHPCDIAAIPRIDLHEVAFVDEHRHL